MNRTGKPLVIGIKYCGGCNPDYDRVALVEQIAERLKGRAVLVPAGRADADLILAVQGCETACADLSPFEGKEVCVITGPEAGERIAGALERLLGGEPSPGRSG